MGGVRKMCLEVVGGNRRRCKGLGGGAGGGMSKKELGGGRGRKFRRRVKVTRS